MAYLGSNSNHNPKTLNPDASPFAKPDSTPQKTENLVLPSKPFFPRSVLEVQQLQHSSPPPIAPPMSIPMPGHVFWYQLPAPNWAYPVVHTVHYEAHKEPSVALGVPLYFQHVGKDSPGYSMGTQAAMDNVYRTCSENGKGPDFTSKETIDFGGRYKKVLNRNFLKRRASRFRFLKKEKLGTHGERAWLPKNYKSDRETCGSDVESKLEKIVGDDKLVSPPVCNGDEINRGGKTSLMIRNIPNQFERRNLLNILDQHCLEENRKAQMLSDPIKSEYDFLYLPMDFWNRANYGYAFVNFTNEAGALRFRNKFNKYEWNVPVNKKTCEICYAKIQGKVAFESHFKNSVFPCHTNGYLPVVLSPPRDGHVRSKPIVIGRCKGLRNSITASRNSCQSGHVSKNKNGSTD